MDDTKFHSAEDTNWEYHNPAMDEFPIMASDARPPIKYVNLCKDDSDYLSKDAPAAEHRLTTCDFTRLRECGFNLVRVGEHYWNIRDSALQIPPDCHMGIDVATEDCILLNPVKCVHFVNKYKDTPYVEMFDFGDEKKMEELSMIKEGYNKIKDIRQLPIFNNGEKANQPENLNMLQDWFRPPVWSYDCYPIVRKCKLRIIEWNDDSPADSKVELIYDEKDPAEVKDYMYRWLEVFRNMAISTRRPFWYYVLSMTFTGTSNRKPEVQNEERDVELMPVNEDFMRFSAFSALAYGAKGLRYWTYFQRRNYVKADGTVRMYFGAPIDPGNNKTEIWHQVKAVNSEVHALESIFLHSDVSAVYHTGNPIPEYTTKLPDRYGPLLKLESGDPGVTVSFFSSNGRSYVMLVNHDINNPQAVKISWEPGVVPYIVTDGAGVRRHFSLDGSVTRIVDAGNMKSRVDALTLDACGYCILSWDYDSDMEYENPTGDEFPIIAGHPCREWVSPVTTDMFQTLYDCGFNLVNINHRIWEPRETADVLAASGVKGLHLSVADLSWKATAKCVNQVRDYSGIDSVRAFGLYSDLAADPLINHIPQFAQTYNAIRSLYSGRLLLWNAIGNNILDSPDRIEEIQRLVMPSMWSDYATTAFTQKCDQSGVPLNGTTATMVSSFYARLEEFLRISTDCGRPFWHYVSCMSQHPTGKTFMMPVTEASMRLAAFSGLAYGAKGIRWWGYAIRKSTSSVSYLDAPIDANGNKTEIWGWVKKINYEIGHLGHIFLSSYGHAVRHTGSSIPDGTVQAPPSMGPFKSIATDGEGVLVSTFRSGVMDDRYIMFVNRSPSEEQTVLVSYTQLMSRQDAEPQAGTMPDPVGPPGPIEIIKFKNFRLDAGGYILLSYDKNGFTSV